MELTILLFLPAAAAAVIVLLPESRQDQAKWVALVASVAATALSLWLLFDFKANENGDGFAYVVRKEKAADNPWGIGATTLEWTLPSPPAFHSYEKLPRIAAGDHH